MTEGITILKELHDPEAEGVGLRYTHPAPLPNTHAGILNAIRAEPDEPVHRMALVDWLTDQGEFEPRYDCERHKEEMAKLREAAATGVFLAGVRDVFFGAPRICTRYGVVRVELRGAEPREDTLEGEPVWVWRGVYIEDVEAPSDLPINWLMDQEPDDERDYGWLFSHHKTREGAIDHACGRALAWCLANTEEARLDRKRREVAEQVARSMAESAERRYKRAAGGN